MTEAESAGVLNSEQVGFISEFTLELQAVFYFILFCNLLAFYLFFPKFQWCKTVVTFTDKFTWVVMRLPLEVICLVSF